LKSLIKILLKIVGLGRLINVVRRYKLAKSYYSDQLRMIRKWSFQDTEYNNFYYDITDLNIEHTMHAIALITHNDVQIIEKYINEIRKDSWLKNFISENLKNSNYQKDTKVEFSRRIGWYAFARALKPKIIVETGVHHGVGACVLTRALMINNDEGFQGKYIGIDINRNMGKLFQSPLNDFGQILYGDSLESLNKLNCEIDLFINDSDHSASYEMKEYELVNHKLSPQAIILGDNSHVTNELSKFSMKNGRNFIFISEKPKNHWYPGAGIGVSSPKIEKKES
tara:strand:- start:73 stop:918 length:846 start_codon:yes stop_codon:yes gene_type:complete